MVIAMRCQDDRIEQKPTTKRHSNIRGTEDGDSHEHSTDCASPEASEKMSCITVNRVRTRAQRRTDESNSVVEPLQHGHNDRDRAPSADDQPEIVTNVSLLSAEQMRLHQMNDVTISPIVHWLSESETRPDWSLVIAQSISTRSYWAQWNALKTERGVLYRQYFSPNGVVKFLQVIVPEGVRQEFIRNAHDGVTGGHFGVRRTQDQVNRRGYWAVGEKMLKYSARDAIYARRFTEGDRLSRAAYSPWSPMDQWTVFT
jgi:hypothetical protein